MGKYIVKRVLISLAVVFLVTIFTFLLIHLIPGDPVQKMLGMEASKQARDQMYEELHLNEPLYKQYLIWLNDILHGDLGDCIVFTGTVAYNLGRSLPITLSLGIPAMLIGTILGILFGVISAVHRGKFIDQLLTVLSTTAFGIPVFWLAILGIYLFAVRLGWLPVQGYVRPSEDFGGFLLRAILPIFCQAIGFIAIICRQTRSNMLEVINQDYIRTANANGLFKNRVIYKHALKNALIPIITLLGMQIRLVIGGSVIVEKIFNIPGTGKLILDAVQNMDYVTVQGCVLVLTLITVFANLAVDLLYSVLDPRIRLSRS